MTSLGETLGEQWTWQMTSDNGDHLFLPIVTKLLAAESVYNDECIQLIN